MSNMSRIISEQKNYACIFNYTLNIQDIEIFDDYGRLFLHYDRQK